MRSKTILSAAAIVIAAGIAAPASADVIKLTPRPGVELRLGVEVRGNERAIVLLFAGGNGKLQIDESGQPQGLRGNFLIRARNYLAARGIGVVLVDAPSDHLGGDGLTGYRTSSSHVAEIGMAVAAIRQRFPGKAVWLAGTSNGSVSVAAAAAYLQGARRPDGVVFTSSVTQQTRLNGSVFNVSLANYSGPALVASHEGDGCRATPAADAPRLLAALSSAQPKKVQIFSGGQPPRGDPCEAFSQHGFIGIEGQVMNAIADFILRPTP
jgi:hypothetical protein